MYVHLLAATSGADFTAMDSTLEWEHRELGCKTLQLAITNDTAPESDEVIALVLQDIAGSQLAEAGDTLAVTIIDNGTHACLKLLYCLLTFNLELTQTRCNVHGCPDDAGLVSFCSSSQSVTVLETAGSVTVQVCRTELDSPRAVSIVVESLDGSAVAGEQYTVVSQTLSWALGESDTKGTPCTACIISLPLVLVVSFILWNACSCNVVCCRH